MKIKELFLLRIMYYYEQGFKNNQVAIHIYNCIAICMHPLDLSQCFKAKIVNTSPYRSSTYLYTNQKFYNCVLDGTPHDRAPFLFITSATLFNSAAIYCDMTTVPCVAFYTCLLFCKVLGVLYTNCIFVTSIQLFVAFFSMVSV